MIKKASYFIEQLRNPLLMVPFINENPFYLHRQIDDHIHSLKIKYHQMNMMLPIQ